MRSFIAVITILLSVGLVSAQSELVNVDINFRGVVGNELFDCGKTYKGIGNSNSTITVSDFRLFVHNVRLIDEKGSETTVELTTDGKFQAKNIALLDFENGEGNCTNGTPEIYTTIKGKVPAKEYTGIKFVVGVPTEENHNDPTLQPSPLNVTRMMWSWQAGYKFIRIDMKTTGKPTGYVLHLGSTGCKTDEDQKTKCVSENRSEITLKDIDIKTDSILVDLMALYANADVDINQERTAAGCMAALADSDCEPVFLSLGLPFGEKPAKEQTFFRVAKKIDAGQVQVSKF